MEPGGLLETGGCAGVTATGETVAGGGLTWEYDGRDDHYAPTSGWMISGTSMYFDAFDRNKSGFANASLDVRRYLATSPRNVFAIQAFTYTVNGDAPIWRYPEIGGYEHTRGYSRNRYLDERMIVARKWSTMSIGNHRPTLGAGASVVIPEVSKLAVRGELATGDESLHATLARGLSFQARFRHCRFCPCCYPERSRSLLTGKSPMHRFALILVFLLAACTQGGEKLDGRPMPQHSAPAQPGATSMEPSGAQPLDIAGVVFLPPQTWTDLGPSQMRKGSWKFGPAGSDTDAAEVTAFFFGSGQGGDIESNIARWIGQMEAPEGKTIQQVVRRSKLTTQTGLNIHFVEIDGTFARSLGGGPMTGGRTEAMEGWRMVGAIIEGPQGNVFFKLVGPDATAREMEKGYREMLTTAVRL